MEATNGSNLVDLNCCDFQIHMHELSLQKMTKDVASFIGNKLARYKEVDLDSKGKVWGSSICIRVAINITKPFKCALKIPTMIGDNDLVTFTYGKLPNFRYLCGCLGHLAR
ncbi:hypothetical protein Sango_1042300 [Sesamum angolense]|uniref:Zinc knuckle CX2CX4HX4C domain-containing protein n=1 Tax=Sesamum angolense TaxID=2727404 RepID=A0AAE1X0U0_9LAMI|nr:hypothetical protein Sango_1042300 [Sesamum angolense]